MWCGGGDGGERTQGGDGDGDGVVAGAAGAIGSARWRRSVPALDGCVEVCGGDGGNRLAVVAACWRLAGGGVATGVATGR